MLESIQKGDVCIFKNGEEATVTNYIKNICGSRSVKLFFNKDVEGFDSKSNSWNYHLNGKWVGNGNNIVKVIHQ